MKTGLLLVLLCLALAPSSIEGGPVVKEKGNSEVVDWFLRQLKVNQRLPRQSSDPICRDDGDATGCLPDGITTAPSELVTCINNECVCRDCYMLDGESGRCTICSDYQASTSNGQCGTDNRPRQLTAFLLSLFLSGTGAANFYIGQTSLGGGQIAILLILLASSYAMCCFPCCLACCMAKEEVKGSIFFILFMLLFVVLVFCCTLAAWAWWIADLVIFATNQRLSGNGCMLTPNL